MDERALKALEYYKIREMLAACAFLRPAESWRKNMLPLDDFKLVQDALEETAAPKVLF